MTRKSFAVPALLALAVTCFFWKLLTKQYTWMDHPDMAFQVLPWLQFQAASWAHGHVFPLWDPNVWGGQPLIGQLQPGATYPLNWPLFLLPFGADGRIQPLFLNAQFILSHILAAVFCYWLCRDLGRSRGAAVFAGLAFSLTGIVGNMGWPQQLSGPIWMPLAMLFFRRAIVLQSIAHAGLAGLVVGVMFLSGHHQIPTLFALLLAGLWAVQLWRQPRAMLAPAAAFGAMAVLTAGLQLLPAIEYGMRSIRWVGSQNPVGWGQKVPYLVHQDMTHSLFPSRLLGLVLPDAADPFAFVGLAVVALALAGVLTGFRRFVEVRYAVAIALAGLLFALGGFSVFHGVAYLFVPLVEKARTPATAFCLAQFALAVLAAYGTDALREKALSRRWALALTSLGALAWIAVAIASSVREQTGLEYERPAIFGLMALTLATLLSAWRWKVISDRALMFGLLAALVFEAGTVTGRNFRHREDPGGSLIELTKHRDLIEYVAALPGDVRLEYDPAAALRYNTGDWDGVPQFEAYLGGLTNNVARLVAADSLKPALPKIFALTHFAGMEPRRPETQEEVFRSKSGLRLYRNTDAFPRAWIVHEAVSAGDLASMDLRRQALVTEAPALATCGTEGESVTAPRREDPDRVELQAALACKGLVVLSETWYPGWSATVDGAPAALYEVDGAIRGIVVEKGNHRVALRYQPASVSWGAAMSALGALAGLFFLRTVLHLRGK